MIVFCPYPHCAFSKGQAIRWRSIYKKFWFTSFVTVYFGLRIHSKRAKQIIGRVLSHSREILPVNSWVSSPVEFSPVNSRTECSSIRLTIPLLYHQSRRTFCEYVTFLSLQWTYQNLQANYTLAVKSKGLWSRELNINICDTAWYCIVRIAA